MPDASESRAASVMAVRALKFRWQLNQPWILDIPEFELRRGERVFLAGPSGGGKTTFLSVISGLALAAHGAVEILGQELSRLRGATRDQLRADHCGIIFQMFNLLPYLSALENVRLIGSFSPVRAARASADHGSVEAAARYLLGRMGLGSPAAHRCAAATLSVGQQQRVAAARALLGQPDILIADEPTSALDSELRQAFLELLLQECAAGGSALLLVSHDDRLSEHFDRKLDLRILNRANIQIA